MKKFFVFLGILSLLLASPATATAQKMMNTPHYRSHFMYMTTLGFNAGVGKLHFANRNLQNKISVFSVNQMIGYQFNPYVSTGVELGVNVWKRTAFIPLTANLTVAFLNKKATPIWYMNAGYAFKWYVSAQPEKMSRVIHGAKSGWHLNTGIGAKVQILERLHLIIAADYKAQYTTLQYSESSPTDLYDYSLITTNRTMPKFYHYVGMRIGFMYW